MQKINDQLKREIYDAKMNGMRTKDIVLKYGINKMMLSRIMKNGNGNIDSNVDKNSNVRDNMNSNINENGNINENSNMNSNVDELNEFRLGISNLFENIAELCNVVLKQQKRIDTLQQRVESLQTRLDAQMNINHQTEEKTQPETKSDNVGWDEWEPTQIIHTNHGTEIIRDGKKYTRDEFLSQFTDEEINLYKNLFVNDDNDDNNDDTKTATNEPQKQETHEKSKFDVDEDGFCALKTKKW